MSNTRRKVFTFDEVDLKWINPLLLEWEKENKGKNGGVLITELLKKYRDTPASSKLEDITHKMGSEYARFKTSLDSIISKFPVRAGEIFDIIKVKLNHIIDRMAAAMEKGFTI